MKKRITFFYANRKILFFLAIALGVTLMATVNLNAKIKTETVEYKQGNSALEGYLAYDDSMNGKKPGIIIVHQWLGLQDYEKMRAEQLAGLGYVAFAADIYGKGVRPSNAKDGAATMQIYRADRKLMRARAQAALDQLKKYNFVDPKRLAVMGYCFGGEVALELARSGADVIGTISFHGLLDTPNLDDAKNIKGRVLVLHGADDSNVLPQQVLTFQDEMRKAGVDWMFVSYGNAVHAFTILSAGNDNSKGSAYNKKADERSWEEMKRFFKDIFNE